MAERTPAPIDERPGHKRDSRGHALIRAAGTLHPDSAAWAYFMRTIIKLPREKTPDVFVAIRRREWIGASDALAAVRAAALRGDSQKRQVA